MDNTETQETFGKQDTGRRPTNTTKTKNTTKKMSNTDHQKHRGWTQVLEKD